MTTMQVFGTSRLGIDPAAMTAPAMHEVQVNGRSDTVVDALNGDDVNAIGKCGLVPYRREILTAG